MTRPIGRLISILHRRAQSHYTRALKEFGISSAEYPVLFYLQREEGRTQDEIAAELSIDKSAVTRIVRSLCDKGLVTRSQDSEDRRCNRVWLTGRGHDTAGPIRQAKKEWSAILLDHISEEEQDILAGLLERMAANVEEKTATK